jgi:hypothetical protein
MMMRLLGDKSKRLIYVIGDLVPHEITNTNYMNYAAAGIGLIRPLICGDVEPPPEGRPSKPKRGQWAVHSLAFCRLAAGCLPVAVR